MIIFQAKLGEAIVATIENIHDGLFYLKWDPPPIPPTGRTPSKVISRESPFTLQHMVERVYPGVRWLDPSEH